MRIKPGPILVLLALALALGPLNATAAGPFWDNAKLSCKSGGKGIVKAKLKGARFGKIMKTCKEDPPTFNALGASGDPDRCDRKMTGGIWGEWDVANHPGCEAKNDDGVYWDKAIHRCLSPNQGEVKARLRGTRFGSRTRTCEATDISSLGDTMGATGVPRECKTMPTGSIYGYWTIEDDGRCSPTWGKVRKKGCMSPDVASGGTALRQVYKARLKKLKNTKGEIDTKALKRQHCMNTEGPDHPDTDEALGKPDWCKVKGLELSGFWYVDEACDDALEWKKWKDDGCVKDLAPKKQAEGLTIDPTTKRQIRATLKHTGGEPNAACMGMPVNGETIGDIELDFAHPTLCATKDGDKAVALVAAAGLGAATAPLGVVAGTVAAVGGFFGTEWLSSWDPFASSKAVFWVDDPACGDVPRYHRLLENDTSVTLATGEISTRLAPWGGEGTSPARTPVAGESPTPPAAPPVTRATPGMTWGAWTSGSCRDGNRIWSSGLRNVPSGMDWTAACRAAIQLPYRLGEYPQPLRERLASADPALGYPDRCQLDRSAGQQVVGQFHIADPACNRVRR